MFGSRWFGSRRHELRRGWWKSGGKGEESKRQHGGMEWRIEAEGRNEGLGADSSVDKLGMGGIAGDGVGGDVEVKERSKVGNCGSSKAFVTGRDLGAPGELHMNMFLKSLDDKRCIHSALNFQPLSNMLMPPVILDHFLDCQES